MHSANLARQSSGARSMCCNPWQCLLAVQGLPRLGQMQEFLTIAATLFTRTIFGMAAYFRQAGCSAQRLPRGPCCAAAAACCAHSWPSQVPLPSALLPSVLKPPTPPAGASATHGLRTRLPLPPVAAARSMTAAATQIGTLATATHQVAMQVSLPLGLLLAAGPCAVPFLLKTRSLRSGRGYQALQGGQNARGLGVASPPPGIEPRSAAWQRCRCPTVPLPFLLRPTLPQTFWFLSYFPEPLSLAAQTLLARDRRHPEQASPLAWLLLRWAPCSARGGWWGWRRCQPGQHSIASQGRGSAGHSQHVSIILNLSTSLRSACFQPLDLQERRGLGAWPGGGRGRRLLQGCGAVHRRRSRAGGGAPAGAARHAGNRRVLGCGALL